MSSLFTASQWEKIFLFIQFSIAVHFICWCKVWLEVGTDFATAKLKRCSKLNYNYYSNTFIAIEKVSQGLLQQRYGLSHSGVWLMYTEAVTSKKYRNVVVFQIESLQCSHLSEHSFHSTDVVAQETQMLQPLPDWIKYSHWYLNKIEHRIYKKWCGGAEINKIMVLLVDVITMLSHFGRCAQIMHGYRFRASLTTRNCFIMLAW